MCSQINHFPEDADFDHDGAEYVLRKSVPARRHTGGCRRIAEGNKNNDNNKKVMNKRERWPDIVFKRVFLLLIQQKILSARNKHVTMFAEDQGS